MPDLNVVAIIQARMGSSRLPDKVALDIGGQPMLARVVERSRGASRVDKVVVATTDQASDDTVEKLCRAYGYPCFRGSPFDLLDRYYQAARLYEAEIIVRITADCPLIDPGVIDHTIQAFLGKEKIDATTSPLDLPWDFAANRLPPPWKRTYPIGLDTEVCTFEALRRAWEEADQPYQREHVMPYLYESERSIHYSTLEPIPDRLEIPNGYFRVLQVDHDPDFGAYRWTVDTSADLELARLIYAHFGNQDHFTWLDVLDLYQKQPELASINAGVQHKTMRDVDTRRQEAS